MDGTKKRISRNIFPGDGRVNGERIRKVSGDMSCGSWMQPPTTLIRTVDRKFFGKVTRNQ